MADILFICTGNTCRSPMAEGLAGSIIRSADFFSRGISVPDGSPAHPNAVRVMRECYGVDIRKHTAKMLCAKDTERASLILTMTKNHLKYVTLLYPLTADKIFTLGELAERHDISDPYGGSLDEYTQCAGEIAECLRKIDFAEFTSPSR